jgi:hypothetical protein
MKRHLVALLVVLSLASCKHDDDVPDTPPATDTALNLSSQLFTNTSGQPSGSAGSPEDFRQETWEPWVKAHFTALDTATLPAGTAQSNVVERVSLFPNPGGPTRAMYVLGVDTMNVKLVVVDKTRAARWKSSLQVRGSSNSTFFTVQVPTSALSTDSLFRLYYAFSLAGSPYFHTSHADITVRP